MGNLIAYLLLGLAAGVLSGLVGIGGGILIVPALFFFFGFSQQQAQGTTLALLVLPIGILAAWAYYKQGLVDIRVAQHCLWIYYRQPVWRPLCNRNIK